MNDLIRMYDVSVWRVQKNLKRFLKAAFCVFVLYLTLVHLLHIFPQCRRMLGLGTGMEPRTVAISALHRKKGPRVSRPQPGCHYQTLLGGNNDFITELFLPRGSLVSYIPAGDGKLVNLFLRCSSQTLQPPDYIDLIYKSARSLPFSARSHLI